MQKLLFCLGEKNKLAISIAENLKLNLHEVDLISFKDGERLTRYKENLKDKEIVLLCCLYKNINNLFIDLILTLDSFASAQPKSLTLVLPYFFYARQDREVTQGDSVAARTIASIIETFKVDKLITVEIHSQRIIDFFSRTKIVNLKTQDLLIEALKKEKIDAIISPDKGGFERAKEFAERLNLNLVIVDKERTNQTLNLKISEGTVLDQSCLIVDDMLDTGGTIFGISTLIKNKGAKQILLAITHAVFSSNAYDRLKELNKQKIITKVVLTNSIQKDFEDVFIETVDLSKLISEAI